MESSALEYIILRLLELHQTKSSATYLQDVDMASASGATVSEVRMRLVLLETNGLVELVKVSGRSYGAMLRYHRPRLRLLAGSLWCFHRSRLEMD
jgi:transcription initiation factor IIE alpha subunit